MRLTAFILALLLVILVSCSKEPSCIRDEECKLVYNSCSCEALTLNENKTSLPAEEYPCPMNWCSFKNVSAVCFNNACVKSDSVGVGQTNLSFCNGNMSEKAREYCYINLAIETENLTVCNNILDGRMNTLCKNDAQWKMFQNAVKEKTFDSCDKMESNYYKEECYFYFGAYLKDTKICDKIIYNGERFDDCYRNIAQETKNRVLCRNIKNKNTQDECLKFA